MTNGLPVPRPVAVVPGRGVAGHQVPSEGGLRPGLLVPIGGGKDSMVLIEALRHLDPRLFAVNPHPLVYELAAEAGLELVVVRRRLDPGLASLHESGALNGHVPITAIVSLIAVVGAFVHGYDTVAMAVERSASEETMWVDGVPVNHQYSKSREFELLLAEVVRTTVAPELTYGSALRPYSELAIARAFAGLRRYHGTFCSCNSVFRQRAGTDDRWCGHCPKCRFVGLMLAPYLGPDELTTVIGTDMFADPGQVEGFAALMSDVDKPFECVGERRESAVALRLLAELPAWRDTVVVTTLAPVAEALVGDGDAARLLAARAGPGLSRPVGGPGGRRPGVGGPMTLGPLTLDSALARRVAVWGMGAEGLALVTLAVERGVEPVLIDDLAAEAAGRVAAALGGTRTVLAPGDVDWSTVDVVVRSPGVSRYRAGIGCRRVGRHDGHHRHGALARGLCRRPGAGHHRHQGEEHDRGPGRRHPRGGRPTGGTGREHRGPGRRHLPTAPARRLRGGGLVLPGGRCDPIAPGRGADEPGPRPPRLARRGGCLLSGQTPAGGGGPTRTAGGQRRQRRGPGQDRGYPDRTLFGPDGRVRVTGDGWIEADGTDLVDAARLRIAGRHNAWNLCGAIAGILLLTDAAPSTPAVESAVDGFAGLPSRCQVLGERDGRTYVDDALASNPFAAATSVESFAGRPLTVIVGGADRGVDPGPLVDALSVHRPAASVVVLPPESVRLRAALVDAVGELRSAADLREAVEIAEGLTAPGGVVLFSPGAPTPVGGGGYRSRSRSFATAAGFDAG